MGKRKGYRFPQGINGLDRFLYPNLHAHPKANPNDINKSGYYDNSVPYGNMFSDTDILGSYTGIARDGSMPIQDADDL